MKFLRITFILSFALLLSTLTACGGSDPVNNNMAPDMDSDYSNLDLNTGNVGLDGVIIEPGTTTASVIPGSAHLITLALAPEVNDVSFRAICTGGSWVVDGNNVGTEIISSDGLYEWVAPQTEGSVQLVFESINLGIDLEFGIVVIVSYNPYEFRVPPDEPVHEIMFTDARTGYTAPAVAGELLVKLTDDAPLTGILNLRTAQDYRVLERISRNEPIFRMKMNAGVDLGAAMREIADDPMVEIVEPNYFAYTAILPSDPEYDLKHEFPRIDAELAWDIETGSPDVWVAVIDTGVDRDHPDLDANVVPGMDFISGGDGLGGETPGDGVDNNGDGVPDQNVGHGTHVAGIIAAEANNGIGALGIAYNVTILPLRIFPTNGDTGATFSAIIDAVDYATNVSEVKVISMSIGTTYQSSLLQNAIDGAWARGKVLIAAAANSNTDLPYYPAAHNHVVAVAAINKSGNKASFSNYGGWVDISAYGTGIYATYFDDSYAFLSGTSMATPLVSGCAALLFSANTDLTNEQCVQILTMYTNDVYENNPGYIGELGSGIVNPYLALSGMLNNDPIAVDDANSDGHLTGYGLE